MVYRAPITKQQRTMARKFRQYGASFISPEWADCDGFDAEVERRTEECLEDINAYDEIIQAGSENQDFCIACKELYDVVYEKRPDTEKLKAAEGLAEQLVEVANSLIAENLEKEERLF